MSFEIQRKNILRFGRLSVRLNADGNCVFRNAARRQAVAAAWRFSFSCDECDAPPFSFRCRYQGPFRSIGTLIRCHIAGEVPAILFLEQPISGSGYSVVKVQGLHTGSSYDILIGYRLSITDPQTVARP